MSVTRSADPSRIMRQQSMSTYEIHSSMWRNSPAKPCLTYGFVGYGYVSVQALQHVAPISEEHDDRISRHRQRG